MGRRPCRLPLLHLPSPVSALQQRWSEGWNRLCIPRRSHCVVLGKCSLVDGIPVQLGQTTGPLRTLRHLPRTDISHPHRNVAWRDSRNRALGKTLAIIGWLLFAPPATPLWPLVALTFALTLASLYAMGMALSSLYLVYGREADSVNEALHEPVSFLSGVYFPSSLAFPAALQAIVLILPLAVVIDALQRTF